MDFRALAAHLKWRKAGAAYRGAEHEYTTYRDDPVRFRKMGREIRQCGVKRKWRGQVNRYLTVGTFVYWHMGYIINRSYTCSLDNDGYPGPAARAKIAKRFGRKE